MRVNQKTPGRRRTGAAFVYVVIALPALVGFASLAVDLGRYQTAKTELRRVADAAARAAVANLSAGTTAATNAATAIASANAVDGKSVVAGATFTETIQFLYWTNSSTYSVLAGANGANAVRFTIRYNVPLTFAGVLGVSSKSAVESSTVLITTYSTTAWVSAKSNPWLAGESTGTQASQPDPNWQGQQVDSDHPWQYDIAGPNGQTNAAGETYTSPVQFNFPLIAGASITITNVSGTAGNDLGQGAVASANGSESGYYAVYDDAASHGTAEHGLSDSYMPLNSLNAVFLSNNLPDTQTAPTPLDFSTQSERDYSSLQPKVQQVFYAGNGQTSGNVQQTVVVPQGATRLYLGTMDGWEWSNNVGGYTATITETSITTVQ